MAYQIPRVVLNGVDISGRLTGEVSVDAVEGVARLADVEYLPPVPVDAGALIGLALTISLGGTLVFTGFVDQANVDPRSTVATLRGTDQIQEHAAELSEAEILAAVTGGLYHEAIHGTRQSGWEQLQDVAETVLGSYDLDASGAGRYRSWTLAGAPTATHAATVEGSLSESSPALSERLTRVKITLEARYARQWHREHEIGWAWGLFCFWLDDPIHLPLDATILGTASAEGWQIKTQSDALSSAGESAGIAFVYLQDDTVEPCGPTGPAAWYLADDGPDAARGVLSASWTAWTRYIQWVREVFNITVDVDGASPTVTAEHSWRVDQPGEQVAGWESAGGGGGVPAGASSGAGAWYVDAVDRANVEAALQTAVAIAVHDCAAAQRQWTVSYAVPCDPDLDIGLWVDLDTADKVSTGQVQRMRHRVDTQTGRNVTELTLALATCPAPTANVPEPPTIPLPSAISGSTALPTYVGGRTGALAQDEEWPGWSTNWQAGIDLDAEVYEPAFMVTYPEIPAEHRDEVTATTTATITLSGWGAIVEPEPDAQNTTGGDIGCATTGNGVGAVIWCATEDTTIEVVDPGANDSDLSIDVTRSGGETVIVINLGTDASGGITTTICELIGAIAADATIGGAVTASVGDYADCEDLVTASSAVRLGYRSAAMTWTVFEDGVTVRVDPGVYQVSYLAVSVEWREIVIRVSVGPDGLPISTAAAVVAAVNGSAEARALASVALGISCEATDIVATHEPVSLVKSYPCDGVITAGSGSVLLGAAAVAPVLMRSAGGAVIRWTAAAAGQEIKVWGAPRPEQLDLPLLAFVLNGIVYVYTATDSGGNSTSTAAAIVAAVAAEPTTAARVIGEVLTAGVWTTDDAVASYEARAAQWRAYREGVTLTVAAVGPAQALSVAVDGAAIAVSLATDAHGNPTSTVLDLRALARTSTAFARLADVTLRPGGASTDRLGPLATVALPAPYALCWESATVDATVSLSQQTGISRALAVSCTGSAVSVQLASDASQQPVGVAADVVAAVAAEPCAAALMSVSVLSGWGGRVVPASVAPNGLDLRMAGFRRWLERSNAPRLSWMEDNSSEPLGGNLWQRRVPTIDHAALVPGPGFRAQLGFDAYGTHTYVTAVNGLSGGCMWIPVSGSATLTFRHLLRTESGTAYHTNTSVSTSIHNTTWRAVAVIPRALWDTGWPVNAREPNMIFYDIGGPYGDARLPPVLAQYCEVVRDRGSLVGASEPIATLTADAPIGDYTEESIAIPAGDWVVAWIAVTSDLAYYYGQPAMLAGWDIREVALS